MHAYIHSLMRAFVDSLIHLLAHSLFVHSSIPNAWAQRPDVYLQAPQLNLKEEDAAEAGCSVSSMTSSFDSDSAASTFGSMHTCTSHPVDVESEHYDDEHYGDCSSAGKPKTFI